MNRYPSLVLIFATLALAACVTINVYFPEAAAERAADRFIQDVIGESGERTSAVEPAGSQRLLPSLGLISSAHAQQPNINIDTPQVQSIRQRMSERHREHLAAWYDAGAIGLSRNGLVEIRDRSAVGLADRRNLERVVSEENSDRNAVYREIAIANGHPEWEEEIRRTFARQWVANARAGWYYEDSDGDWVQK
ncbi:YdbL family protein [Wenzhouxiangella sp. AB-CW3]|uniref:YdbL family protein n=1 Tax=Wenzhouxiangella sp. AB-CW3 TaxID=2771012 RepID=UPI00168BD7DA|nr:YdbL family protein [Wenzhouxiangella sp. AB-CW3]QOC21269.1 YdbL family protein [Wenzhouxiangella sp. AB-CW3]